MNIGILAGSALPFSARAVLKVLERLSFGRLRVTLPDGAMLEFGPGGTTVRLVVHDWRAFGRIVYAGDIGFAEGWLEGDWTSDDLPALLTVLAHNRESIDGALYGSRLGQVVHRLLHALRANTRRGSQRNIAAHYDLGNDFYALWLDESMSYSSALFEDVPARSLARAQDAKYRRVLELLDLPAGGHVLEIGCGWGAFAERAAHEGLRVTGVTLSQQQLTYARQRISSAAMTDRVALELRDYRDLAGQFDAVVSIEMLEAVGERWWPTYFNNVAARLPQGGKAMIQSIVIDDALFDRYRRGSDFIQRYVFPGGMLPSTARIRQEAGRAGLRVVDTHAFGLDYARTLVEWRRRFLSALPQIQAQGKDAYFQRLWLFYLAYCEAGFVSGSTDVVQVLLEKQ